MGTLPKTDGHNSDPAVAGAISGFVTRFACQPLDVLKIRFQLQVEPIGNHHVSKYQSLIQALFLILKEEGVFAFWKGHVPAQLLSVVYGMTGASAGFIATTASFPFDTIRTRLVAQANNHQVYNGLMHSCRCILQHESPKTFFNGLLPNLLQIVPHSGLQFAFYGLFSDIYKTYSNETDTSFLNSVISGSAAGLLAKTAIYPLDLSRKRLQIQGFQHGRKGFGAFFHCTGLVDCLKLTVKVEGVKGLFKGLVPSQLKAAVTTALHFTVYEQSLVMIKALRSYSLEK